MARTKEEEIQHYMKTLDLTRQEAEELWKDDHSNKELPEQKELKVKAKQGKRVYEKSDTKDKKPRKKAERKIDPDKKFLIEKLAAVVDEVAEIDFIQNEAEIHFRYGDKSYTIKLIQHKNKG